MSKKPLFKKIILVLLLVFSAGGLFFAFQNNREGEDGAEVFKKAGFELETDGFALKEKFKTAYSDYDEENILAESGGGFLKIKTVSGLNADGAKTYSSRQFLLLQELYEPRLPPYPEFLTKETGCAEKFLPQRKENPSYGTYYLLYAGDRLDYGACADDLVKYKAVLAVFYCDKSSKLFKIEYFADKHSDFGRLEKIINSFRCLPS